MSTLATIYAIVAALNSIVLLSTVLPASAYGITLNSSSFERKIGANRELVISVTTVQYSRYDAACPKDVKDEELEECRVRRKQNRMEDECNIVLRRNPDSYSIGGLRIYPFGADRAIVRWVEYTSSKSEGPNSRYRIVDFSNCNVKTIEFSEDFNRLVLNRELVPRYWYTSGVLRKGENDFEVVSLDAENFHKSLIDAERVASKFDTLFTYRNNAALIVPLPMDEGKLFIQIFPTDLNQRIEFGSLVGTLTVAYIRPDDERKNVITRIENVHWPSVSLANGLIGLCARRNETSMKCTQFKLDDKEINWFSASIIQEKQGQKRVIYNLPRGEGFLTYIEIRRYFSKSPDKYLVKIGPDGKAKQFVDPDLNCLPKDEKVGFNKIFEDDQGNYCMSTACIKYLPDNLYLKLLSKCFQPEDFKNISKYNFEILLDLDFL